MRLRLVLPNDTYRQPFINTRCFLIVATLLSFTYVGLQLMALIPGSTPIFGLLLIFVILFGLIRSDILVIGFPLIVLQQTRPAGIETVAFRNWIKGSFLVPFSMIHVFSLVLIFMLAFSMYRRSEVYIDKQSFLLVSSIFASLAFSPLIDLYRILVDFWLFIVIPTYALYVYNVMNQSDRELLYAMLILLPVPLVWGQIFLFAIGGSLGINIVPYGVLSIYTVTTLLIVALELRSVSLTIRIIYLLTAGLSLLQLIISQTGSGTIILMAAAITVFLIVVRNTFHTGTGLQLAVPTGFLAVFGTYVVAVHFIDYGFPLEFLVKKFTSIFTFNLSEIEHSPAVRILELINILGTEWHNGIVHVLFGQGLGGYFVDMTIPFESVVDLSRADYSLTQLRTHQFFNAHNTPAFVLLKLGIYGILVIGFLILQMFRASLDEEGSAVVAPMVVLITLGSVLGFGIKNSIIIGIGLGLWSSGDHLSLKTENKSTTMEEPTSMG